MNCQHFPFAKEKYKCKTHQLINLSVELRKYYFCQTY